MTANRSGPVPAFSYAGLMGIGQTPVENFKPSAQPIEQLVQMQDFRAAVLATFAQHGLIAASGPQFVVDAPLRWTSETSLGGLF